MYNCKENWVPLISWLRVDSLEILNSLILNNQDLSQCQLFWNWTACLYSLTTGTGVQRHWSSSNLPSPTAVSFF
ncbi:hypothetical protein Y1Q_0019522 [Alligator mississippiensis]|uniref:Uncharacterized protein n=1 Tax=Alligator mississippiensis TaxID=8496 RepID=A0A151NMP1_ALLMI|nr:hypothetical protein Y1Q_0019522 [Alligator mississippiensis]